VALRYGILLLSAAGHPLWARRGIARAKAILIHEKRSNAAGNGAAKLVNRRQSSEYERRQCECTSRNQAYAIGNGTVGSTVCTGDGGVVRPAVVPPPFFPPPPAIECAGTAASEREPEKRIAMPNHGKAIESAQRVSVGPCRGDPNISEPHAAPRQDQCLQKAVDGHWLRPWSANLALGMREKDLARSFDGWRAAPGGGLERRKAVILPPGPGPSGRTRTSPVVMANNR